MKVLIDRNIERYAITHRTEPTRQMLSWGPHDQTIEVAQRAHRPPRADESFRQEHLPYLATLCNFAKMGKLRFFTSDELLMERLRQKGRSEGYLGINLLRDVAVESVRCPVQRPILFSPSGSIGATKEKQMEFFRSIQHHRFLQIRSATGDAHIDDAFHFWTAEEAGLDVFLTMDKRFWNQKRKIIDSKTAVMTPKELAEQLNAQPTDIEKLAAEINPFS